MTGGQGQGGRKATWSQFQDNREYVSRFGAGSTLLDSSAQKQSQTAVYVGRMCGNSTSAQNPRPLHRHGSGDVLLYRDRHTWTALDPIC
ncbi:hypothetical protein SKAU_G00308240 [Synaphobranchus kaupii]|uniref:Uncharacterized protein n=1 Tax=Synaphobranchus kaupii TaxID=118154 RepID=A0A9Q1IL42_SYNKA|nr:hypothetical protein SKAU_G00308240 [Synaphobranchus kaupii]